MKHRSREAVSVLALVLAACAPHHAAVPSTDEGIARAKLQQDTCRNPRVMLYTAGKGTRITNAAATRDTLVRYDLLARSDSVELVADGVQPELINREEITKLLVRAYPADLRAQPGSHVVGTLALIDYEGRVAAARLRLSSGDQRLDLGGLDVVRAMRFSPAHHGQCVVRSAVSLPLIFRTSD